MNEEPGVSICEIRATTSGGISIRSRAALASSGEGFDRTELGEVLDNVSGIDTTFQRNWAPSFYSSNSVNKCVPNGSSGVSTFMGTSNSGVER